MSEGPLHIGLVSRLDGGGGIAVYHRTIAEGLIQRGHRVTIFTSRSQPDQPEVEVVNGVTKRRLPHPETSRLWRLPFLRRHARTYQHHQYSKELSNYLSELPTADRPDVLEIAEVGAEARHYLKRRNRVPVVVRCHTATFVLRRYHTDAEMPYETARLGRWEREAILAADARTTPSRDMARVDAEACGVEVSRFQVIPNAVDVDAYQPDLTAPAEPVVAALPPSDFVILHVGRMERVKGIDTLAQAIPAVVNQHPEAKFVFLGDARPHSPGRSWKDYVEETARQSGHAENVLVRGRVSDEEMRAWYRRANLAVVPSLNYESFSYTCAQSLASGVPVVASRIGGIPETVPHGEAGLLFETGNVDELARCLRELASDPERCRTMGRAGLAHARRTFDVNVVVEPTLQLYRSLLP